MIISRTHDFCAAHRIVGHKGKCANLHGHNYRVTFYVEGRLDDVGMVADFSEIKEGLCQWVDDEWDHRLLLWDQDELADDPYFPLPGLRILPFNPTAENMAQFLLKKIGPHYEPEKGKLVGVRLEETRKCVAIEGKTA